MNTNEEWKEWVDEVLYTHEDKIQALDDNTDRRLSNIETDLHNIHVAQTPIQERGHVVYLFSVLIIALVVSHNFDVDPLIVMAVIVGIDFALTALYHISKHGV